jgi:hypothetical protein
LALFLRLAVHPALAITNLVPEEIATTKEAEAVLLVAPEVVQVYNHQTLPMLILMAAQVFLLTVLLTELAEMVALQTQILRELLVLLVLFTFHGCEVKN